MNGAGLFFLLLLLLVILPAAGWIGYTRWRAHQQGLPPPPLSAYIPFRGNAHSGSGASYPVGPRPGGVVGWMQDKMQALRQRGGGGGGRGSSPGADGGAPDGRGRGSFSQLDPEGAWDDHVDHESGRIGDYEEQELGLHPARDGTALPSYGGDEGRGRSRLRDPAADASTAYQGGSAYGRDPRFDDDPHAAHPPHNPFGDEAEASSLRGVSPRPLHGGAHDGDAAHDPKHSMDDASVKTGRRSLFHEDM